MFSHTDVSRSKSIYSMAMNKSSTMVLVGSPDGVSPCYFWIIPLIIHAISPFQSVITRQYHIMGVLASQRKVVRLWDPRTADRLTSFKGHGDTVRAIAINSDGTRFLSASAGNYIISH